MIPSEKKPLRNEQMPYLSHKASHNQCISCKYCANRQCRSGAEVVNTLCHDGGDEGDLGDRQAADE